MNVVRGDESVCLVTITSTVTKRQKYEGLGNSCNKLDNKNKTFRLVSNPQLLPTGILPKSSGQQQLF